jgi:hypothetical protein
MKRVKCNSLFILMFLTCYHHQAHCRCALFQSLNSCQLSLLFDEFTKYLDKTGGGGGGGGGCEECRSTMGVKKTNFHFSSFICGLYATLPPGFVVNICHKPVNVFHVEYYYFI